MLTANQITTSLLAENSWLCFNTVDYTDFTLWHTNPILKFKSINIQQK